LPAKRKGENKRAKNEKKDGSGWEQVIKENQRHSIFIPIDHVRNNNEMVKTHANRWTWTFRCRINSTYSLQPLRDNNAKASGDCFGWGMWVFVPLKWAKKLKTHMAIFWFWKIGFTRFDTPKGLWFWCKPCGSWLLKDRSRHSKLKSYKEQVLASQASKKGVAIHAAGRQEEEDLDQEFHNII
jgi:hypothetical protein